MFKLIYAEQRIGSLKDIQHNLIQEWGEFLAAAKPSTKEKGKD